jgi:hypothetical protein
MVGTGAVAAIAAHLDYFVDFGPRVIGEGLPVGRLPRVPQRPHLKLFGSHCLMAKYATKGRAGGLYSAQPATRTTAWLTVSSSAPANVRPAAEPDAQTQRALFSSLSLGTKGGAIGAGDESLDPLRSRQPQSRRCRRRPARCETSAEPPKPCTPCQQLRRPSRRQ